MGIAFGLTLSFFLANGSLPLHQGPAFKTGGFISKSFDNVDIYPFMCLLLGLNPAPNNGSLRNICDLVGHISA